MTVVIFLMLAITPGDPAELLLGERATPESLDAMREYLGLKEPLYVQYGLFLKRVVKFDLGETIWTREKVSTEIKERFPATIELAVAAMLISSFFGIILGLISATRQYSWFDYISMVGSLIGVSMPVFWLALVLMLVFSLTLGWFPMSGRLGVDTELKVITNFYLLDSILTGNWEAFWDALRHLALPAIALEHDSARDRGPDDPLLHARGLPAGLHQDRPGEGVERVQDRHEARASKRPHPRHHRRRPPVRDPDGRGDPDGDGLCLAGRRKMALRRGGEAGLHGHPGGDAARGDHVRAGQPRRRLALCRSSTPGSA